MFWIPDLERRQEGEYKGVMSTNAPESEPSDRVKDGGLPPERRHDPYGALKNRDFRLFLAGNVSSMLGVQALSMAVGWEVFHRTQDPLSLMWVGLVQVLPVMGLFLPAGIVVDRVDRRWILLRTMSVLSLCSALLAYNSYVEGPLWITYLILGIFGAARAFTQPARAAFLPEIVPREMFSNAVAWSSGGFQSAMVVGPAIGGWLIYLTGGAAVVYGMTAALALVYLLMLSAIPPRSRPRNTEPISLKALGMGLSFVWNSRVMFAAITLDMVAVLLGGATALLPVYTEKVLLVEAWGLGWLRSAPGVGAVLMSLWLTHRPPIEKAGRALLWSVVLFGLFTIGFGLSRSFGLSCVLLLALGAADMVSVVVRHTLVQMLTPDSMRGRVSAVNGLFISVSNELGEAESGFVAHLFQRPSDPTFGPTAAVVSGGIGTIVVVGLVALVCPALRRYGRVDQVDTTEK